MLNNIIGIGLIITGILDSYKYNIQANKIKTCKSSATMSRKFTNFALCFALWRLLYASYHCDWYLFASSILAAFFELKLFWTIYIYYPYKHRGLKNFKRPSLWKYTINSWIPNRYRRKL